LEKKGEQVVGQQLLTQKVAGGDSQNY